MSTIVAIYAFRKVPVDPAGAPELGYVVNDVVVVDFVCSLVGVVAPGFGVGWIQH